MSLKLLKLHENERYFNDCCSLLNDEWPRSETARLNSLLKSNDKLPVSLILIDQQTDGVIAHLRVKKDVLSDAAVIESLVVKRENRGKGYGKYMMNKAEQFIKEMGFATIKLTTKDKVAFYEKLGYKICNECNKFVESVTKASVRLNRSSIKDNDLLAPRPPPPPPLTFYASKHNFHSCTEMQKMLT